MLQSLQLDRDFQSAQRFNVFYALSPPRPVASQVGRLAFHHASDRRMQGKPFDPARFHVTLYSIGVFFRHVLANIMEAALAAGEPVRFAPFDLALDRARSFP